MSIAKLTESVSTAFACDRTRAGVVVSQLGYRSWYVSCARYPDGPASKTVLCSAKGDSFDEAVTACMLAWLVLRGRTRLLADNLGVNVGAACRRSL